MKQTLILTTTALALAFMLSGCSDKIASPQTQDEHTASSTGPDNHAENEEGGSDIVKLSPDASREAGIELSQAAKGPMGQSLTLPAEIRFDADRVANVSPKVSGIIGRLYVGEGDLVKRGQTLALISSRELAGLKASWLNAKTGEALAAQKLAREEKLFSDQITAEADVQAARANFEVLKAASDAAENELHAAGVSDEALSRVAGANDGDNANSYLTAPISGMIVRRNVTLGETVSAGDASARALLTIVDDSEVWADIAVYKQDISSIRVGAPVVLKSDSGEVLAQSTVAFVLPVIDETSRTATARVIINNPDGTLRPGQFVTAEISVGTSKSVVRVPESAVQLVEDKNSIFVPVAGGYIPRAVLTGTQSGGFFEIRAGLSVGETFVSGGAFTLKAQLEKAAFGDDHGH
ncbi:efflux RND transporter periplasmic adaptor subunit [Robiginitomaculum antarcticum]|uniref:efflux RND transporter periplasmic adaptor subunit n=1 Tax=Robiginitomaculum antarcticum TaxID=437507 RepID=UPI00037C9F69|nr:efflux RND transporter periplasmic adaptor subunit [Robiginitomaculum antarcticum]